MSDDLLSRSRYALLTGDLSQAETLCRKLLSRDPDSTAGQLLLGSIYIRESKLQSAQKVFETLCAKEDDNADAWINAALVYRKRGKLKTALNAAQKAYRLAEDRADIIFNIANIHKQLGELGKAEQIYRLAIQKDPAFISSYNNLALLLSSSGKISDAEKLIKQGLTIDQNNPGLHFNLANLYRSRGETETAAEEYRTALKINPGWEECLLNLGDLLKNEKPDEANRMYRRAMDLTPHSAEAKCKMGELAVARGEIGDAEIQFTKILTETPLYIPAAVNLAAVYFLNNKLNEAEKLLREYQIKAPDDPELRLLLGNVLLELGKYNEAFTHIRWVLDRNQNESRAWFALARQFSLSGKKDRALNTYRKGLNLAPEASEARLQLALLLKSLNKTDGAVKECEYIYRHNPDEFAPALLLAQLYIKKKQFKKAVSILEQLTSANPEDIKLLQMYAETAREAGQTEKALMAAEKLAAARNEDDFDFDLDQLNKHLNFYDEMAVEYAREYGNNWNKQLKTLAGIIDEKPQNHEEGSYILDGLQDIAGEFVPILDVGGIDPVILFDEEEEFLTLTDEDEFIPPPEEDEEEPSIEEIEKHEETAPGSTQQQPAAPQKANPQNPIPPQPPVNPVNFENPLTIKLETPPIVIQQVPPPPPPAPEPKPVTEPEQPLIEEEEILPVQKPEEEEEGEDNLFGYLDKLTKFLPTDKRSEYHNSDVRLKLSALKAKMAGDPGLISRVENSKQQQEPNTAPKPTINLTKDRIGNTLNFMSDLTNALPDSRIAESLSDKLKNIMTKLDNKAGEDDKIN